MKGRQLVLILVLLVALGGAALYLRQRNESTWSNRATGSNAKILEFPLNDVAQVVIKEGQTALHLVKKDDAWRVAERADYPADFEKVARLLRTLWELHATQDVKAGPSQFARLELTEPGAQPGGGTLVDLQDAAGKRLAALILGKRQTEGAPGRYVLAPGQNERVFLITNTLDEAVAKPETWLDRTFIKVESPKAIARTGAAPADSWKITRENATAPWTLAEPKPGEELDPNKASTLASYLANPMFSDVLAPDAPVAETGLDQPSMLTAETFDGFTYELRIGKLMGENYPVLVAVKADLPAERTAPADEKPEDKARLDQEFQTKQKTLQEKLAREEKLTGRPFLIAKATIEQFLKERDALLKPPPSPSPAPASSPAKPKPSPSRKPSS